MKYMTKGQEFVVGQLLAEVPDTFSFDEVLVAVREQRDTVSVWEPFEDWDGDSLATLMDGMAQDVDELVREHRKEVMDEVVEKVQGMK